MAYPVRIEREGGGAHHFSLSLRLILRRFASRSVSLSLIPSHGSNQGRPRHVTASPEKKRKKDRKNKKKKLRYKVTLARRRRRRRRRQRVLSDNEPLANDRHLIVHERTQALGALAPLPPATAKSGKKKKREKEKKERKKERRKRVCPW